MTINKTEREIASQLGRPHCFSCSVGLSNKIAIMAATSKGISSPEPMYSIVKIPPTMRNVFIRYVPEISILEVLKRFSFGLTRVCVEVKLAEIFKNDLIASYFKQFTLKINLSLVKLSDYEKTSSFTIFNLNASSFFPN
tara:strand:- start:21072 stop:21488 length:417 start_codon:yes stop_codon:yes gene_type:complete